MKILHVIFTLQYGGAETLLVDIVNEQAKDHDITVFVINNDYSESLLKTIDRGVNVLLFKRKIGRFDPKKWFDIYLECYRLKPDVIHCHDSKAVYFVPFFSFKTILTVHAVNLPLKGIGLYHTIVSVSNAVKEDVLKRKRRDSRVIINGININQIQRKSVEVPSPCFKMVQVGRLNHKIKGQHILLKALSLLRQRNISQQVTLDFIGVGNSLEYLKALVTDLNLADCVSFRGLKDRATIYERLRNYDLLVQPSIYEGFGLTVIEAIAAEVPVLVSNIYGPAELVCEGQFGYMFNSEDAEDCAKQIEHIIESHSEVVLKTKEAYLYCIDNFSLKKTVSDYAVLYLQLNQHSH